MEQIIEAEKELGVSFADDYTKYVEKYGVISARGIELTGVTAHERLSVVSVTKKERNMNSNIPRKYVCYRKHCDRWYHSFAG